MFDFTLPKPKTAYDITPKALGDGFWLREWRAGRVPGWSAWVEEFSGDTA